MTGKEYVENALARHGVALRELPGSFNKTLLLVPEQLEDKEVRTKLKSLNCRKILDNGQGDPKGESPSGDQMLELFHEIDGKGGFIKLI